MAPATNAGMRITLTHFTHQGEETLDRAPDLRSRQRRWPRFAADNPLAAYDSELPSRGKRSHSKGRTNTSFRAYRLGCNAQSPST
jgi:hypothetical protein